MKLCYVDTHARQIKVYSDSGCTKINFSNASYLNKVIKDEKVIYVAEMKISNANAVISLVNKINKGEVPIGTPPSQKRPCHVAQLPGNHPTPTKSSGVKVVRSTKKGQVHIASLNLSFLHPGDYKVLSDLGGNKFLEKDQVKHLLHKKIIEITSLEDAEKKKKMYWDEINKREQMSLDSILVKNDKSGTAQQVSENLDGDDMLRTPDGRAVSEDEMIDLTDEGGPRRINRGRQGGPRLANEEQMPDLEGEMQ